MNRLIFGASVLTLAALPVLADPTPASEVSPAELDAPPPPPLPPARSAKSPAAETTPPAELDVPPPPPLPAKKNPSDQLLPTVTIRTDDEGQLVEEYRINGAIYMMRVTPEKGPAYYLLDSDGDGHLETSQIPGDSGPQPVYWKLFEWQ